MARRVRADRRVRIIGGRYRGRRLTFPDLPGLRPSGDRVRETLFNWLQPAIQGASCLDLFAGSGALGLEAASRGAGRLVLVDSVGSVVRQLRENLGLLGLDHVEVFQSDALDWLEGEAEAFDLVFLDPPFASGLLGPCCERLSAGGWVRPGGRVYLEAAAADGLPPLPPSWELWKHGRAARVCYGVARCRT